ncbi:hypothetical protein J6590_069689 [Homalodisca vitripennis]|nr:hypothetical protein J6590_069689 [Homalodisca vitripennis]
MYKLTRCEHSCGRMSLWEQLSSNCWFETVSAVTVWPPSLPHVSFLRTERRRKRGSKGFKHIDSKSCLESSPDFVTAENGSPVHKSRV